MHRHVAHINMIHPFTDEDSGQTHAIGRCYGCMQYMLLACTCGETFVLRNSGVLVCPTCDLIELMP